MRILEKKGVKLRKIRDLDTEKVGLGPIYLCASRWRWAPVGRAGQSNQHA
jgi:hypothetical protein